MSAPVAMFTSIRQNWATPDQIFRHLDAEFHFTIDAAAEPDTARAPLFYTQETNGLAQEWRGSVWLNPPYGRDVEKWIQKAYESGASGSATVVCLLPARTDTRWWHRYCMKAREIRFLQGRLAFDSDRRKRAPFPSVVVVFGDTGAL